MFQHEALRQMASQAHKAGKLVSCEAHGHAHSFGLRCAHAIKVYACLTAIDFLPQAFQLSRRRRWKVINRDSHELRERCEQLRNGNWHHHAHDVSRQLHGLSRISLKTFLHCLMSHSLMRRTKPASPACRQGGPSCLLQQQTHTNLTPPGQRQANFLPYHAHTPRDCQRRETAETDKTTAMKKLDPASSFNRLLLFTLTRSSIRPSQVGDSQLTSLQAAKCWMVDCAQKTGFCHTRLSLSAFG